MQEFRATLTATIDPDRLRRAWDAEHDQDNSPKVQFQVDGKTVKVAVFSNAEMPWEDASFKTAFSIAVHKVDSACRIQWADPQS